MPKQSRRKPAGPAPRQKARPRGARESVRIGIIGGSGLYAIEGLTDTREVRVRTPFGDPSDAFVIGTLEGQRVAFLARHGRGHRFLPTEINFRANLYGMKLLGVERIFSASAVGSLREDLPPGTFLTRRYKGRLVEVMVAEDGFEYEGEHFKSLTAVANRITGAHWNGYHFFRLSKQEGDR